MNENYLNIILVKSILYSFSGLGNLSYIIIFLYFLYQIKHGKNSFQNIGLGSIFMLLLNISHLCSSITEIFLYFDLMKQKSINDFSSNLSCKFCAFSRNYFELTSVCCITIISHLFYQSTKEIIFNSKTEIKKIINGILYSFFTPLLIIVPSFLKNKFSFVKTRCSYNEEFSIYHIIFTIFIIINVLFQLIFLYISFCFYSSKIKYIKESNQNQYNSLSIYIRIFFIFPIYLFISRILKLINRFEKDNINYLYISEITFALSGIIDSIISLILIRSVFECCKTQDNEESEESDEFQVLSQDSYNI